MPKELADFMAVLSELARRLQPLGAMAESAGSMFGLRPFAAMLGSSLRNLRRPKPTAAIEVLETVVAKAPAARKAAAKKAPRQEGAGRQEGRPPRRRRRRPPRRRRRRGKR